MLRGLHLLEGDAMPMAWSWRTSLAAWRFGSSDAASRRFRVASTLIRR
jgi:hypothetical protein